MLEAELQAGRIGFRVGLAADVLEREVRGAEHLVPVHALQHAVELGGVHPGGERAADEPAHARAGRHVDRNAMLLEPADDAHVRDAARAAAAERHPDRGPASGRGRRRQLLLGEDRRAAEHETQEESREMFRQPGVRQRQRSRMPE